MTQRRTPSGQGPARRPAAMRDARAAARRSPGPYARHRRHPDRAAPDADDPAPPAVNRSGSRPAAARRAAAAGATKRTVATRPAAFTGRATVLIVVLVALALAYTYPVRVYLAQESQIAQMQAEQAAQRADDHRD